jgi:large subunit ribosomal protein L35
MPKQKTHKGLSKRVKVTGSGKIKRNCCNGGHLMSGKNAKKRRKVKGTAMVTGVRASKIILLLNA